MAEPTDNANPGSNDDVKKTLIGMWQAVLVALITALGGIVTGYIAANANKDKPAANPTQVEKPVTVVPIQNTNKVSELPAESNSDLYKLVKDISIFDLRQWRPTPANLMNSRYSPCDYTNYLHVVKTKKLTSIVIHYATTGYAIDMRCITNSYKFYQKEKPTFHDGKNVKEYALVVDVSGMPIGKEFLIVVEATYWNGFNNLTKEDASTYTDEEIHGLDELGIIVFFPESKPFKSYRFYDKPLPGEEDGYRGEAASYADVNNKFIYWSIRERLPNHHYRLEWVW